MITFVIVIFFIAIIIAFGMLTFRAWEIKTARVNSEISSINPLPELPFRHVEKSMLYLTKHVIQGLLLILAKGWFIGTVKMKKWIEESWPKVHAYFEKKQESPTPIKLSFVRRAILESRAKIRRLKERIEREHRESSEVKIDKLDL